MCEEGGKKQYSQTGNPEYRTFEAIKKLISPPGKGLARLPIKLP